MQEAAIGLIGPMTPTTYGLRKGKRLTSSSLFFNPDPVWCFSVHAILGIRPPAEKR